MTNAAINNDSSFDHVMGKSYGCAESLFQRLQRRKRVDTENPRSQQLARRLSVLQLVPIGVGTTIGAGVYVLVGTVARERSGPALTLSFLIAGIAAALSALCYAELASRCPSAGSAYHYSYICVGEGVAWLIGWALVLEYTVGGAAVARGITPNLALLCGGEDNLPTWLIQREISGTDITIDPCAAFLVILATLPLCTGIKQSALVQATVTFANVCVLIFVIVTGAVIGFTTGWVGYRQADGYLPFGINGMLGGAATVFFAYIGFDSVAGTAEEVKHPQRDLPIGIGITLLISGSLYILVSAVIVGIVPYSEMDVDTPMSSAFTRYGMQWAVYVVSIGAVAALLSALLGSLLPQPRILLAMARDGLLPSFFVKISKRALVPINATIVSGFLATILTFFMGVDQLSGMVSFGTLLAFAVVGISILILRYVPPADSKINPAVLFTPSSYSISPSIQSCSQEKGARLLSTTFQETAIQGTHVPSLSSNASVQDAQVLEEALEHELDSHERLTLLEKGLSIPSKGEGNRQWAASMSILAVSVGAIIFAIGACADLLPSWSRWILGSIGMLLFGAGSIVLALLKQDKGQHTFGQSGGFICPFVPWLPVMSVLINVYLLANLGIDTWFRVGIWLIIGAVIYFTYGINHSVLSEDITITIPSTIDGSIPSLH